MGSDTVSYDPTRPDQNRWPGDPKTRFYLWDTMSVNLPQRSAGRRQFRWRSCRNIGDKRTRPHSSIQPIDPLMVRLLYGTDTVPWVSRTERPVTAEG